MTSASDAKSVKVLETGHCPEEARIPNTSVAISTLPPRPARDGRDEPGHHGRGVADRVGSRRGMGRRWDGDDGAGALGVV